MFFRWRRTLAMPTSIACSAGRALDARIVGQPAVVLDRADRRDQHRRGRGEPPSRQTMSKNFSMPMSEPKPDSVTT